MDIDALLQHYFGTDDPDTITDLGFTIGSERLRVDFGTEQEPGRRFALWTLMEVFGIAPTPADAFPKHPELKRAAEDYLSAAWKMEQE
ncbi:hypothetical protein [Sphingomonas abietis]|uniref:Uncharacterized protein n=1 Tax=Sphingomonas abietis TaxID=3012344 RepID=A0ABY7NSC8_9SPHN|nr:hypothetical protein [Sphingomonas abietis]WBO23356.1 hypothetical protein PBT88_04250 [Sphingomonas abietis]